MKRLLYSLLMILTLWTQASVYAMEAGADLNRETKEKTGAIKPARISVRKASLKMQAHKALLQKLATCKDTKDVAVRLEKLPADDIMNILYRMLRSDDFKSFTFAQKKDLISSVMAFEQMEEQKPLLDMLHKVLSKCANIMPINMKDVVEPFSPTLCYTIPQAAGEAELWADIKDNKLVIERKDFDNEGKLLQEGILVIYEDFNIETISFEEIDKRYEYQNLTIVSDALMTMDINQTPTYVAQFCWFMATMLKMKYVVSRMPACTTLDELASAIIALPGIAPCYMMHYFTSKPDISCLQRAYVFYVVENLMTLKRPELTEEKEFYGGDFYGAISLCEIKSIVSDFYYELYPTVITAIEKEDIEYLLLLLVLLPESSELIDVRAMVHKHINYLLPFFSVDAYQLRSAVFYKLMGRFRDNLLQVAFDAGNYKAINHFLKQGIDIEDFLYITEDYEGNTFTTALIETIKKADVETVQELVNAGALINRICPATGKTILEVACHELEKAHEKAKKHGKEEVEEGKESIEDLILKLELINRYLLQHGATNDIPHRRLVKAIKKDAQSVGSLNQKLAVLETTSHQKHKSRAFAQFNKEKVEQLFLKKMLVKQLAHEAAAKVNKQ